MAVLSGLVSGGFCSASSYLSEKSARSAKNTCACRKHLPRTELRLRNVTCATQNTDQYFQNSEWEVRQGNSAAELAPWQLETMKAHIQGSKKKIEVKNICEETGLSRQAVLGYLKLLRNGDQIGTSSENPPAPTSREPPKFSHSTQMPVSRPRNAFGKRMSKSTEATLESVYQEYNHPNDQVVDGIVTLCRMSRRQVIDWFIERRRKNVNGVDHNDRLSRESLGRKGRY